MLITIMVILLLIGAAVVGSIYSNFLVFYSNFSESTNYHKAYYAAISALERGELVTKQRQPGYRGCGGRKNYGSNDCLTEQNQSDNKISSNNFSYLSDNDSNVYRSINSRTNRIPALGDNGVGQGDVEPLLQASDSDKYNMMDYENSQIFLLYYDKSEGSPYTKTSCNNPNSCVKSSTDKITGHIRLPEKLYGSFGNLDTSTSLVPGSRQSDIDDVIVDWQIRGKKVSSTQSVPFTIYSAKNKNCSQDSSIRESDINKETTCMTHHDGVNYEFKSSTSPINYKGSNTTVTIVGNIDNIDHFGKILGNGAGNYYKELQLRFSLLNLLKSTNGMLYPFLEYYADFNGGEVSDKYYAINAEGYYGGYKINKKVWKPTVKESVLSSFTSIFR